MATADIFNFTDTWNSGGTTFAAIKVNVTDTASAADSTFLDFQSSGVTQMSVRKSGVITFPVNNADNYAGIGIGQWYGGLGFFGAGGIYLVWSPTNVNFVSAFTLTWNTDCMLNRVDAAIIGVRGASASAGGALSFIEQTAPSAPAADGVYIYAQDNGGGKTQLMARFSSGAAQQIAIQP